MKKYSAVLFFIFICFQVSAQSYFGQFSVGGTSAGYYPVLFNVKGMMGEAGMGKLTIYRPNIHDNAMWAGTFHAEIEFIPSVWGNNDTKFAGVKYILGKGNEYRDPIADIVDGTTESSGSQLVIWIKGGATYYWSATNNSIVSIADANEAGTSKTSSSGQILPIKTEQSAFILKAKNNIHYSSIGVSTDYGGYFGSNVGIGTTNPDQKLTVKGKIHAEEVIIDLNVPVADYVFAENYPLMPLHKVEQFVKVNNHLPEIPSATEVKEKGLSLGEMQNKLLQKIEELTLYVIEQNKKIEKLEMQLNNNKPIREQ